MPCEGSVAASLSVAVGQTDQSVSPTHSSQELLHSVMAQTIDVGLTSLM